MLCVVDWHAVARWLLQTLPDWQLQVFAIKFPQFPLNLRGRSTTTTTTAFGHGGKGAGSLSLCFVFTIVQCIAYRDMPLSGTLKIKYFPPIFKSLCVKMFLPIFESLCKSKSWNFLKCVGERWSESNVVFSGISSQKVDLRIELNNRSHQSES